MVPVAVAWRVWTIDGQVFQSTKHAWSDVPATGIAAMCVYYDPEPYRDILYCVDSYSLTWCRENFEAFPVDGEQVKAGAWMPDEEWESLRLSIHADGGRP